MKIDFIYDDPLNYIWFNSLKYFLSLILQDYPEIKNELLNIAKDKREKIYEIIIGKNLPTPEKTLDVYGLNDLNIKSDETSPYGDNKETARSILTKSLKESKAIFMKDNEKTKDKNKEVIGIDKIIVKEKPKINIPEPFRVDLENIDPLQNEQLQKVEVVIDRKINLNKVYEEINEDMRTSEVDAVKLLKNYQQDMELVYFVTAKVAKVMSKTLNKTNRLYNQWVEAEKESLKSKTLFTLF